MTVRTHAQRPAVILSCYKLGVVLGQRRWIFRVRRPVAGRAKYAPLVPARIDELAEYTGPCSRRRIRRGIVTGKGRGYAGARRIAGREC